MLKFKKGAFVAEKRIQPLVLRYNTQAILSPAYDVIELLPLFIMELSWSCISCNIIKLPEIYPTEYLFNRPEAQGKERWEVYAEFAHEVMCKHGNLKPDPLSYKERSHYEGYM